MNTRIADLRAHALRSRRGPDAEREKLRRESLARTEGEPEVIREAEVFAHYCRNRALVIHEGELIIGSSSSMQYDPIVATTPHIFGRQPFATSWPVSEAVQTFFQEGMLSGAGNHTTMDYDTVLTVGLEGLIDRIGRRTARLSPDEPDAEGKRQFLTALRIVAEGYCDLCRRYGDHALALARETEDEARSIESIFSIT